MDKKMREYRSNNACLTWEVVSIPINKDGKAEIEVPRVVSILLDPSTGAGLYCRKSVESSVDDGRLGRDIKDKLEYIRSRCFEQNYTVLDDDVNKIIAAYKKQNEITAEGGMVMGQNLE